MNYWLLLIPFVSAILGWLGSRLAGKIFLRVIARRRQLLAEKIGKAVNAEFPIAELEKKIVDPANIKKIMPVVEAHIDDFLRNKLKEKMPVIGMLIGNKTIDSLKEVFLKEIEDLFPHVLKQFAGNLKTELDIGNVVANKITSVSPGHLEKLFFPVLRYYQLSGAIICFISAIINLALFLLLC